MEPIANDYQKQEKAFSEFVAKAAKKSGSDVLKQIAEEDKRESNQECLNRCRLVRMVFSELEDEYMSGEMEWDELVTEFTKALKAI